MAGTQIGTQIYMAPEMCMGQDYSFSVDIWGYGLVLYELATGVFPFPPLSNFAVLFQCICEDPEPRLHPDYPLPLQEFVALCLTRQVPNRPDTTRLCEQAFVTQCQLTGTQEDGSQVVYVDPAWQESFVQFCHGG